MDLVHAAETGIEKDSCMMRGNYKTSSPAPMALQVTLTMMHHSGSKTLPETHLQTTSLMKYNCRT
jgi:hypothetical protein